MLVATGLCLTAVASGSGQAAESRSAQGVAASVQAEVSWGSANRCAQNIKTNDFGALTPNPDAQTLEPFDATPHALASTNPTGDHVWVGCVTTNTGLAGVTARGLRDLTSENHVLPLGDVSIGITNAQEGTINGGIAGCSISSDQQSSDGCPLPAGGSQETLLTEADPGTTELNWQYQLDLPANQSQGSYSGGEVILTATAGDQVFTAPHASSTPTFTATPDQGTRIDLSHVSFTGSPAPTLAYQWQDCTNTSQSSCSDITGATSAAYTPTASDQGLYLSATVTATNGHGSASVSVPPAAVSATYMQVIEADHPVADWTFNDPAGSASASEANGWGALSGGTETFGVPGPFAGSGTAMEVVSGPLIHGGTPLDSPTVFTVEVWFKATSADVAGRYIENILANQEGWIWLGLGGCTQHEDGLPGNCLTFMWQNPSKPTIVVQTGYKFTDTDWHYIVMTHGEDGFTHIYVDGVEYGPFDSSSQYFGLTAGTYVGGVPGSFSHYAYYDSELSSRRIAIHWQASRTS